MDFHNRLRELREDNDKTLKDIALILNTSVQYYQKYEKGVHPLPIQHLITLAQLYETSTDYILGLTNITKPYPKVIKKEG